MRVLRALGLFSVGLAVLRCGPGFDREAAQEEIERELEGYSVWFQVLEGSESDSLSRDSVPGPDGRWVSRIWRVAAKDSRSLRIEFRKGNTLADVEIVTTLDGNFCFEVMDPISKVRRGGLRDRAMGYALFHLASPADTWAISKVSFTEVVSDTVLAPEVNIRRLTLSTPFAEYTISDPWELLPLDSIPQFLAGDSVAVLLQTEVDTTRCVAFLHFKGRRRFRPDGLTREGWVSGFTAPAQPGVYRLVVDLINLQSLFDERYPYNANRWVIPYRVKDAQD